MTWRKGLRLDRDQRAVVSTLGVVMMIGIAIAATGGVIFIVSKLKDNVGSAPPSIGLISDQDLSSARVWDVRIASAQSLIAPGEFLISITTPQNGTLVAFSPSSFNSQADIYWQLGSTAGQGRHEENDTVGADGLGGFHMRLLDNNANERLDAGDHFRLWYDGDGDQLHQFGADDNFPSGIYAFQLHDLERAAMSGPLYRDYAGGA